MEYEPSFDDRQDFVEAERGFIKALEPGIIKDESGKTVWNIDAYDFLKGECPETAHPNLWRQGQLNSKQGLFEIQPGIYQTRALDLSNMTIVEGKTGIIIIDPLVSCECAAAGLRLYQEHRGTSRPVTGMIYSHSHGDHYMGAQGVLGSITDPDIPIIAPEGFIEAILSESILAGPAMRKRGAYMYGNALPRAPDGQIGTGLGMASSTGTTSLVMPNLLIQRTGEEHVIDGVRIVFQMVPGTEAPAEVNFHFPDLRAFCVPETATNCMHNIVTLRGAQVRDAKAWSGYLDEAITLYAPDSDVMFGSHNWPTWGTDLLTKRLREQRDLYGYMHDQTVRMMNLGLSGTEIAERITLPPAISRAWHCRGFYGSLSHNVKGIYQRYMTWFDGNPAHLWEYPPKEQGERYVECMGGVDQLCDKAERFIQRGDSRFAATLLAHAIAAEPPGPNSRAEDLLATAYQTLGFGSENATWRNFYLTASQELRTGQAPGMIAGGRTALGPNLSTAQWFQIMAVQIDGVRAADTSLLIGLSLTDSREEYQLEVSNGVLISRDCSSQRASKSTSRAPDLHLTLTRAALLAALRGEEVKAEKQAGDVEVFQRLVALTKAVDVSKRGPSQI